MKDFLELKKEIIIFDAFRDILKHQNYEAIILPIINRSTEIFRGKTFQAIKSQSHGECDFIDNTGKKYEAKLLIDKRQGALIGDRKNSLDLYAEDIRNMINEFSQIIATNSYSFIPHTRLYGIMRKRLDAVKDDENIFFYLPFSLIEDSPDNYIAPFATDYLQAAYDRIKDDNVIGDRDIFFIYPSSKIGIYVLRNAEGYREYIRAPELDTIITFEIKRE